jgi:membrane protein YdbS with pleckstrin-like domain
MLATLFYSILKKPPHTHVAGEDPDEQILYVFRRSFITNFDWILVTILLLVTPLVASFIFAFASPETRAIVSPQLAFILTLFWYLFTFGFVFQNFINWFFNVYIITSKRVLDLDFIGLLYKNISEAPLTSVEDVTSTVRGTIRVIFNYGTVYVQTAAQQREFQFEDVADPSKVRDIVSDIVTSVKGPN